MLLVGLLAVRPGGSLLAEAVRILPDLLLRRLAAERTLPRGVRVRLLAYLASPIDGDRPGPAADRLRDGPDAALRALP